MSAVEDAAKLATNGAMVLPIPRPVPQFYSSYPMGPCVHAMWNVVCARMAELWPLPDDLFYIGEWLGIIGPETRSVLTTEARDALEAICSR